MIRLNNMGLTKSWYLATNQLRGDDQALGMTESNFGIRRYI